MVEFVVDAAVSARPVVPSAMQATSVQPLGSGDWALTKPGVVLGGLQVGFGPVPTHIGLHPGSCVRGDERLPMGSLTISPSILQAEAALLLIKGSKTGQSEWQSCE